MNFPEINRFIKRLAAYKNRIPAQQLKTLRGQALSGDVAGAQKGLERICKKAGAVWKSEK
ncbi:MAG TPA: hypothetical protein PKW41_11690 [Clostridia bacterium]|nr:hypothetical protein [Clostridia bacterium]